MLFGKAKKIEPEKKKDIVVETIPFEFYGGTNPAIEFKTTAPKKAAITKVEKKALDTATAAGSGDALHPASLLSNRRFLIIAGSVVFVLFVIGASWYYYHQATKNNTAPTPVAPAVVPDVPVVTPPPEQTPVVSTTPSTTSPTPIFTLDLPAKFLGLAPDDDHDGLSDPSEELFGTDPMSTDTDHDGHSDSTELYFLYNPAGREPERLADSSYVKVFVNPTYNYSVYYPADWALGNVDAQFKDVLLSTLTGENVEVQAVDKTAGQSFSDWLAANAPNEQMSDYAPFQSVFGVAGYERNDHLVYFFDEGSIVYVFAYHVTTAPVVNYQSVIIMMARSFTLSPTVAATVPPETPASGIAPASTTTVAATTSPAADTTTSSIFTSTSTIGL